MALALVLPVAAISYGALAPETVDIDEDIVKAQADAGPFRVSVFTPREARAGGKLDVAVLVQEKDGNVILDSDVAIAAGAKTAAQADLQFVRATHERAQNQLLFAATVDMPRATDAALRVSVQRGAETQMIVRDLP